MSLSFYMTRFMIALTIFLPIYLTIFFASGDIICYMLTPLVSLLQGNVKEIKKWWKWLILTGKIFISSEKSSQNRKPPLLYKIHFSKNHSGVCIPLRRNLLIKFCNFRNVTFYRNILRPLYLKFKTSAHAHIQLLVTSYYLQIFWHDMNFITISGIYFDKWSWSMILSTWSRDFFLKINSGL